MQSVIILVGACGEYGFNLVGFVPCAQGAMEPPVLTLSGVEIRQTLLATSL
jgi:hypothetical protein